MTQVQDSRWGRLNTNGKASPSKKKEEARVWET